MELWDIYGDDGRPTGRTVERGTALFPGERHLAAELWLADAGGRLLIQRRSRRKAILPGVWAMTTGCMTTGEGSLEGILREAREELGLALTPERIVLLRRIARPGEGILWDVYFTRLDEADPPLRLQAEEVSAARWVAPDELRRLLLAGGIFSYPEMEALLDEAVALL